MTRIPHDHRPAFPAMSSEPVVLGRRGFLMTGLAVGCPAITPIRRAAAPSPPSW